MKISVSNLFNYFSVSGDSKQIKKFPQKKWYFDHNSGGRPLCGGHHPKIPLFLTPPLTAIKSWSEVEEEVEFKQQNSTPTLIGRKFPGKILGRYLGLNSTSDLFSLEQIVFSRNSHALQ